MPISMDFQRLVGIRSAYSSCLYTKDAGVIGIPHEREKKNVLDCKKRKTGAIG